jgi:hypothetical protein
LLSFYDARLSPEERRKGGDAQELEKAQEVLWRKVGPRTLLRELLRKSKEEPDLWESLLTEVVWNEFSTRYSFTTILKAERCPLLFLPRGLDKSWEPVTLRRGKVSCNIVV